MSANALLQALQKAVSPSKIYTDHNTLDILARDALHPGRMPGWTVAEPLCVVRPEHTAEVAAAVRLASTHGVPVIPIGGGSGLMGGAASLVPGLVLDLRGLQEIQVRPADRMADVGAGITIEALNQAAAPHGLMCGHDPWTVAVATVGGTIGTNSLGYLGGKYGSMGDQVLGLEAVLPTGEVITTRAVEKSSTGPGLHRLFIGAEGCFGIVTRATLRLFPLPQTRLLQAWQFADFATGFTAINALLQAGVRPGLLEYSDENPAVDYTPPATLIMSFEGPHRVAQAEAEEAVQLCTAHQGQPLPLQSCRDVLGAAPRVRRCLRGSTGRRARLEPQPPAPSAGLPARGSAPLCCTRLPPSEPGDPRPASPARPANGTLVSRWPVQHCLCRCRCDNIHRGADGVAPALSGPAWRHGILSRCWRTSGTTDGA